MDLHKHYDSYHREIWAFVHSRRPRRLKTPKFQNIFRLNLYLDPVRGHNESLTTHWAWISFVCEKRYNVLKLKILKLLFSYISCAYPGISSKTKLNTN